MMDSKVEKAIGWLNSNQSQLISDLKSLVGIPSISTDGEHAKELDLSAEAVCGLMKKAGLNNIQTIRTGGSNPFAFGEWLGAPGQPTLFLYSHHDVQPVNFESHWQSPPWELTARNGRLYGRGSADDKGAIVAQLAAIAAWTQTSGQLPINIKVLVEGEEEVGSTNLMKFFQENRQRIQADTIIVCDTENIKVGTPSITYSLRGIVTLSVQVRSAKIPVHSGMAGGAVADSAIALCQVLNRLFWGRGPLPIPGYYEKVRPLTSGERKSINGMPEDSSGLREILGIPSHVDWVMEKGCGVYEQTWRKPAITIIAMEASSIKGASNQVLPSATALVSCRIVPDQDPQQVFQQIKEYLTLNPPWGVEVDVQPHGNFVDWWMTDPQGPDFEAATRSLKKGFNTDPISIGCGGTIGFVRPLVELLGGAPALLLGIEDPDSNAHAPNESLHQDDWFKLMKSITCLFAESAKVKTN